ncbi:MAG: DegV family protein, partial [Clostridia bacterium]|nr:DegV family protein [Clostridia bacterium]
NITDKMDVSFIVDRLDYLYKGGRCSMVAMLGANMLHLRPCIEVKEGKMSVGKKYRGTYERCARQYLLDRMKDKDAISTKRVFITHTGLAEAALDGIRKIVNDTIPFADVFETRAGCSITSHCGENTFGILMVRK